MNNRNPENYIQNNSKSQEERELEQKEGQIESQPTIRQAEKPITYWCFP